MRLRALKDGKHVFMAVPRLRSARCFGRPVTPRELPRIDLIVAGSVAVNAAGARLGKGGGDSDLEFALARELGAVDETTTVVTTVHELQVLNGTIPMTDHDVPLDVIATPERVIRTRRTLRKPRGILWHELSRAQLDAMPVLRRLHARRR